VGELKVSRTEDLRRSISSLTLNYVRQEAKDNSSQPREAKLTTEQRAANEKLKAFNNYDTFNKSVETALASRNAATGQFAVPLPDQSIIDYRPDDNDAFIKNTIFGAETFLRTGVGNQEEFDDANRSIGLFPKQGSQATITIQAFTEGAAPIAVTNQFILASVSESSQEKYQIYQTFDEDLIYFFDRNPHIYTYGGVLYNADDVSTEFTFQWKNRFQRLYEKILRGTKCVENGARAILTYEDVTRQGYLLNFQMSEDASNPLNIPFSFLFYVIKEDNNVQDQSLLPVETASQEAGIITRLRSRLKAVSTSRTEARLLRQQGVLGGTATITGNAPLPGSP
jgi:hypothetical protein